MYIAPGQGLTTPWGRNFNVNRNILSLRSFVASFKRISLKSDLYMSIAPGQGQTAPRGQSFDVNRNVLSLHSFVASLKKCLWSLILYKFLYDLIYVYSHGAGVDSAQGTKFWCQQKGLIILPICCKFQRNLFGVWFYTFFSMILYKYIAPGQGLTTPWGRNFNVNRNILSLRSFVASFKRISLKSDCIHFFHDLYMYIAPGQGQTAPGDKVLMSTEMSCHFIHLLQVSKKCLWSLILYKFLYELIHVYSHGAGVDSPPGDKILMSTERPYHFTHLLQVSKKSLWSLILYIIFHDWIHAYSPGAVGIQPPGGQSFDVNRNFLSLRSSVATFKS